ncbi:Cache 3/Cache 2 fusion domain-containing protein [Lysobacter auxotrophicus]|uniref:Cache 3/Cache 2 fusion domain-containing protein n=1 Tax=Lysobacter auxotrophicus TaxID=2992573 RepID=A0ABN6UM17_9GAMM|nr:Cache 3/Cache 2 fusion domain-containing protein [Lysobacter auxotrophicus]BDU17437.1 Cache 3/Cache 2 fusion domain-containing protein [Lysobacter auxotrophicus]
MTLSDARRAAPALSSRRPARGSHWLRGSLDRQIGLPLVATMVLMMAGLTIMVSHYAAQAVETRAREDLRSATSILRDNIATYEQSLTDATETLGGALQAALLGGTVELATADDGAPVLSLQGQKVDETYAPVDRFTQDTGAVVTIFARSGDDYVRVSTSVRNEKGERVIGTKLAHDSPAYAPIAKNQAYTGKTRLFGRDYMVHYRPLLDGAGTTVGVLFVGKEYGAELAALKERTRAMRIGEHGHFLVVESSKDGETLAIHPTAEGAALADLVDAEGLASLRQTIAAGGGTAYLGLAARPKAAAEPTLAAVETFPDWNWAVIAAEPVSQITASTRALVAMIAAAALVTLLVILGVSWWCVRRIVTQPLEQVARLADDVAQGRFDGAMPPRREDELGRLQQSMGRMREQVQSVIGAQREMSQRHDVGEISFRMDADAFPGQYGDMVRDTNALVAAHIAVKMQLIEVMQRYAVGDLSVDMARLPGEKAVLTQTMDTVKANLSAINQEIKRLAGAAAAGEFGVRGDAARFEHDFRAMVDGLNAMMSVSDANLDQVSRLLRAIARGDLTERMHGAFHGVFARMRDDADATVAQLTGIVGRIQHASDAIDGAAAEIAAGNADLSRRTEQQAASLEETAASMEELTSTVRQNAESARQANQLAIDAANVASQGSAVVGQAVETMREIETSSHRIAEIIGTIDGIAFQTNILALNAAVEAARAGESGRGFAVVASEVRALAQRSANAAKEIKSLIDDSVAKVNDGSALVNRAGTTMNDITASVRRVTDIMADISTASQEQSAGIELVSSAIASMEEGTQQNAALVEEASASAHSMEEQARALAGAVRQFVLADTQVVTRAAA